MTYNYNTPQNAILSLELAYSNKDMDAIINSKDFVAEAKIILGQASYDYDLSDAELISETVELLKLSLINSLKENGFPDFTGARVEFSEVSHDGDLYSIYETIIYPDGTVYKNRIFLTFNGTDWKVATVEE